MSSVRTAMVGALALAACVSPEEPSTSVTEQAAACPSWKCGSNSPVVASVPFWELNRVFGVPNEEGVSITKFVKGATSYQLYVTKGKLHGQAIGRSLFPTISGQSLIGAQIWLRFKGVDLIVKVVDVTQVPFFASGPNGSPWFEVYRFDWNYAQPPSGTTVQPWTNLCSEPDLDKSEWLTTRGDVVMLFEGERFDPDTMTVTPAESSWFNVGCVGHTLAKMHLTGHTQAAKAHGFVTSNDERQAMLKMFSADYCGTGDTYTVAGVPLSWQDKNGWMAHSSVTSNSLIEARWTASGAQCIHKPRIHVNPTPESTTQFPNGVTLACSIPECTNLDATNMAGAHVVSASPLPQ